MLSTAIFDGAQASTFSFLFTFNPLLLPINYFSLRDNIDWFAFENRSYVVFPKSKLYICTKIKNSKGSTKNMYRKVDIQTYVYIFLSYIHIYLRSCKYIHLCIYIGYLYCTTGCALHIYTYICVYIHILYTYIS
jgi:hypothetical protein